MMRSSSPILAMKAGCHSEIYSRLSLIEAQKEYEPSYKDASPFSKEKGYIFYGKKVVTLP